MENYLLALVFLILALKLRVKFYRLPVIYKFNMTGMYFQTILK